MTKLEGPAVWRGADIRDRNDWRLPVDPALAKEMAAAARAAAADGAPAEDVDRRRLPLPGAEALATRVHDLLEGGPGFAVLSGLPVDRLAYPEQVALALGLSDHIGQVVPQNYELQRIVDVRDEGIEYSHRSRGYRSSKALPFHTDGAHLFSLTCLGVAAEGGETIIVSGQAVYNRLAAERPEALAVLAHGFRHHRRGQHDPGEPPLSAEAIPVFAFRNGLLHICYNRNPIEWAEREGVKLTTAERAALDALDAVLADEAMQLRLNLQPGEAAFINNYITLHCRTEYQDGPGRRRHMLRVWMRDPASRRSGYSLLDLYVPKSALAAL